MDNLHQQDTQPKVYENFIIKIVPYVVIVEIIFWIGIFLLTFPGRYLLFHMLQLINIIPIPEVLSNTLGTLSYTYIFGGLFYIVIYLLVMKIVQYLLCIVILPVINIVQLLVQLVYGVSPHTYHQTTPNLLIV